MPRLPASRLWAEEQPHHAQDTVSTQITYDARINRWASVMCEGSIGWWLVREPTSTRVSIRCHVRSCCIGSRNGGSYRLITRQRTYRGNCGFRGASVRHRESIFLRLQMLYEVGKLFAPLDEDVEWGGEDKLNKRAGVLAWSSERRLHYLCGGNILASSRCRSRIRCRLCYLCTLLALSAG